MAQGDDAEEKDVGRRGSVSSESVPSIGPQIVLWELSLERLKLLDYETRYINNSKTRRLLHKLSFVIPAANASHQLDDFVNITSWLCAEISGDVDLFKRDQYDDPNAVINKMLLALRKLDFRCTFQPLKLKMAYGEAPCAVLDFLTEKALSAKKLSFVDPTYPDTEKADAVDEDEAEEDVAEEADAGGEEDQVFEEARGDADGAVLGAAEEAAHQILEARVDPVEWKTELERVGPKLKSGQTLSNNEWRAHVDQTLSGGALIRRVLADSRGDLAALSKDTGEELSRTRTKEKYLNHQFSALCEDFAMVKKALDGLDGKSAGTSERVGRLTSELAELADKLEEMKESFESRDSGAQDTSPLVRIKAALQQIKGEIQSFDLRIGVVSHSVLAARVAATNNRRVVSARSTRRRRSSKRDDEAQLSDYDDA